MREASSYMIMCLILYAYQATAVGILQI